MATPPIAESVGLVDCKFCDEADCAVKRNRGGRLFYRCTSCYAVQPTGPGFQVWIQTAMRPVPSDEPPTPVTDDPPPPADKSIAEEFGL